MRSKEEIKEYQKEYRIKNKEKRKNYLLKNKEKIKEQHKVYREKNIVKIKDNLSLWKINNKNYQKEYRKKNKHMSMWRDCLRHTLERLGKSKEGYTIDLLGYSALELKKYITSLFLDGMSWDNYGEWHLDHIIPVSAFKEDTPINIVCAFTNLQPLWAKDNLSKSNNLDNININLLFKNMRYLKNNCFE